LGVIFMLASQPHIGITGAALGIATGTVLITALHYATVLKKVQFTMYIYDYVKFFAAAILAGWSGKIIYDTLFFNSSFIKLAIGIIFTTVIYLGLLFGFRLLNKSDVAKIPVIGNIIK